MDQLLQDFKNFLIERKLAPENHITLGQQVHPFLQYATIYSNRFKNSIIS